MADVTIVGGGPAGLNAALVLGRARRSVLLFEAGPGRNAPAEGVHNLLSRDGVAPAELGEHAHADLRNYPDVEVRDASVTRITGGLGAFSVELADAAPVSARRVLLATGVTDELPDIEGLRALWGRSVLHCPYCHGWEVRDRRLAVLITDPTSALLAGRLASGFSDDVVAFTNGADVLATERHGLLAQLGVPVRNEPIARLEADGQALRRLVFADGNAIERDAIFVHPQLRQRSDLAGQLGCQFLEDDGSVEVNDMQQTSVPGVYAAGDMARKPEMPMVGAQVGIAAGQGITAAVALDQDLALAAIQGEPAAAG